MEERGTLFDSILRYGFYGEEKELPTHLKAVFQFLKYQIDKSLENEKVSLYVVKLYDHQESFFKIGIASNIKKRVQSFTNIGYDAQIMESLEVRFDDREQALLYEKNLYNKLGLIHHLPKKKFGGQYKCFSDDCFDSISKFIMELKREIGNEQI